MSLDITDATGRLKLKTPNLLYGNPQHYKGNLSHGTIYKKCDSILRR